MKIKIKSFMTSAGTPGITYSAYPIIVIRFFLMIE